MQAEKNVAAQEEQMIEQPEENQEVNEVIEEKKEEKKGRAGLFGRKKKKEKKPKTLKQEIFSWVWTLLAALALATLFRMFVGEPIMVDGKSMTNTLQDGEIVFASKLDYLFGDMQRGDIVICRYPNRLSGNINLGASHTLTTHTLFVKRLVALPGDTLAITNGVLYVNGKAVENPELMGSLPAKDYPLIRLGEDEYFVIGDNRGSSHDSRANDVGPISKSAIMGKVKCVIWPLSNIRGVE